MRRPPLPEPGTATVAVLLLLCVLAYADARWFQ